MGTYIKATIAKTEFLQLFQLPSSRLQEDCPASLTPTSTSPKTWLENIIVKKTNSLFTRSPNLEEHFANQLGNARKEHYGKAFEGRLCSRFLSCSAFLKEVVPSSVHLLVECLKALHRAVVGVFGQILDPRFENDISTFEEKFMGAM